jgi:LL-diaminopimelate aminotransferase
MKVKPAERTCQVQEYYFSMKLQQIAQLSAKGIDVINLGIGNPDMMPPENVINRLKESAGEKNAHGYQTYKGIPVLRRAFSEWYKREFSVSIDPEKEILILVGAKEGIMHISMAFLNNGDKVLVPDPGYPAYASAAKLSGADVISYNLCAENSWYPDFKSIEKNDLSGVKIMWVNYPNMPTGQKASAQLFKDLVGFGLKHNMLIINDNPYSFILNNEPLSILSVDGSSEIALELNSLSKSHNMAGWRIGMVAGNEGYIKYIHQVKTNMDSGMFLPLQLAAVEALKSTSDWYAKLNASYLKRRIIVFRLLDMLGCIYEKDQNGLFVWARIPHRWTNSETFSDFLLEEFGIFITPGTTFGLNGQGYVRVSLCVTEARFNECIQRIENDKTKLS